MRALETVLQYMASKSNVIFASVSEIVRYYQNPVDINSMKASDYPCVTATETYIIQESIKRRPEDDLCSGKQINQCDYSTVDSITSTTHHSRETLKPVNSVLITILERNRTHPPSELYLLAINGKDGMR